MDSELRHFINFLGQRGSGGNVCSVVVDRFKNIFEVDQILEEIRR